MRWTNKSNQICPDCLKNYEKDCSMYEVIVNGEPINECPRCNSTPNALIKPTTDRIPYEPIPETENHPFFKYKNGIEYEWQGHNISWRTIGKGR